MKRIIKSVTLFLALAAIIPIAQAKPVSPPGPGEGGNYACFYCYSTGGWGPGPVRSQCISSETLGGYAECQVDPSDGIGCIMQGGCVSLPDEIGSFGLRP